MIAKIKIAALITPLLLLCCLVFQAGVARAATVDCDTVVNNQCLKQNPIVKDIQMAVNFLSAGVGIAVVGMIILGGIQYATAGDSPENVGKAKQRITNALIALFAFAFMWAFLQWLIPGGLFS